MDCVDENKVKNEVSDQDLVEFFKAHRARYAPSTLWVIYACLNSYFIDKFGINLNALPHLTRYLKGQTHLYASKKSKCFSSEKVHAVLMHCSNSKTQKTLSLV